MSSWTDTWLFKLNEDKCKVVTYGRNIPVSYTRTRSSSISLFCGSEKSLLLTLRRLLKTWENVACFLWTPSLDKIALSQKGKLSSNRTERSSFAPSFLYTAKHVNNTHLNKGRDHVRMRACYTVSPQDFFNSAKIS